LAFISVLLLFGHISVRLQYLMVLIFRMDSLKSQE